MGCQSTGFLVLFVWAVVATASKELPSIDDEVIHEAWFKAERSLERELSRINSKLAERTGSAYGHQSPKIARPETVDTWRSAETFARAVDRVCETQNVTRPVGERLVERAAPRPGLDPNVLCRRRTFSCNAQFRYRRADGACNNIRNPDWGMAVSRLARLIDPVYADGFNTFRQSVTGRDLPLAREVSTNTVADRNVPDTRGTHMLMSFGQFMNHDLTSTPHRTDLDKCCGEHGNNADCVPIRVPTSDPQLAQFRIGCMEFARSHRACGNGARQQMNQNTAFIDASQMYGSLDSEMNNLRTFSEGLLKFSTARSGALPPQNASDPTCIRPRGSNFNCFVAGDNRANENPGLSSLHVLFLREHNRIATELGRNRRMDDETLFQETRRIVVAEIQNIVYGEYLPTLLSRSTMNQFALGLPEPGVYTDYDASINPSTLNSFATAAYRFGHSLIQPTLSLNRQGSVNLVDSFNNPSSIYQPGIEALLLGAAGQPAQRMDNFVTAAVTRQLFREGNNPFGMDLAALNIQRGRDHGLPPYNAFRRLCDLSQPRSIADLRSIFSDNEAPEFFTGIYGSNNIADFDLWPASIAERPKDEGMLGPTFSCLNAVQFNRLKWGDRFFFTHRNQAGSFTPDQLTQLRRRSLSRIICDNSGVTSIQPNSFRIAGTGNAITSCDNLPALDLSVF